jgi:hypothetical protein
MALTNRCRALGESVQIFKLSNLEGRLFLPRALSWKKGLDRLLHAFARSQAGKLATVATDDEAMAPQLRKLRQS